MIPELQLPLAAKDNILGDKMATTSDMAKFIF